MLQGTEMLKRNESSPGDLALVIRIDFPGITAKDYKKDSPGSLQTLM